MSDTERDVIERIAEPLRRPVAMDPALEVRIMARIAAEPAPRRVRLAAWWAWITAPRIRLSPLAASALAAGVVALLVLFQPQRPAPGPAHRVPVPVRFFLVAPTASSVALVGDFNDWNPERTPLVAARSGGPWLVDLPLPPGRYRYAFVVDGTRWVPDPRAPRALEEDFGLPNSVVTVRGQVGS